MLEAVIKAITPKIMTWSQYAEAAWFMYNKKVLGNPAYKRYVPDYTKAINHFALHAGVCDCVLSVSGGLLAPHSTIRTWSPTPVSCSGQITHGGNHSGQSYHQLLPLHDSQLD